MKINFVISRHINGTTVIQSSMENGNRIVLRHVDLIQDSKSTVLGTLVNRSLSQLHLIVHKRICADQITAVGIYMKRNIIGRAVKNICQILCQNIFSGGFRSCQKKVLSFQKSSDRHFQNIFSIKRNGRFYYSLCCLRCYFILFSEFLYSFYQFRGNLLFLQKFQFFHMHLLLESRKNPAIMNRIPSILYMIFISVLNLKYQIPVRRHRPHFLVHDHFQFIYRLT